MDYLGTFYMSGGFLVAAGSSGMAEAPSTSFTISSMVTRVGNSGGFPGGGPR